MTRNQRVMGITGALIAGLALPGCISLSSQNTALAQQQCAQMAAPDQDACVQRLMDAKMTAIKNANANRPDIAMTGFDRPSGPRGYRDRQSETGTPP